MKLCIKYCMKMKSLGLEKRAGQRISNALYNCDCEIEDLKGARLLLNILIGE